MKSVLHLITKGFSLIEVTLALGLVSVGVLSIVGLLGTSLSSGRQSRNDVVLASISTQVMAKLRSAPFWALASGDLASGDAGPLPSILADSVFYFDVNGDEVARTASESVFECRVRKTPDGNLQGVGGGEENLVKVELYFTWPVSAHSDPAQRPGKRWIYTSIARYE